MAARLVVFLDDGGVMNDNRKRISQWEWLVSEFFVPLLGGTPEAWIEANHLVVQRMLEPENWRARLQAAADYASFQYSDNLDWLRGMCEVVGIAAPAEEECVELVRRASASIIPRVRAAFPGAVDAIRALHSQGYTLHTASGESSLDLAGYLEGMGVRDCFDRLYGPDLVDTFKGGPEYYERIFADAGVTPGDALVVDDNPGAILWATQAGAQTILVGDAAYTETSAGLRIESLAQLPAAMQKLN
ncbi:MAG: HAD-IA family hydrolase [Chloroflexi bacterium]|nr:HAD-IA family hydrolase [Chloroflexota bacterium]